MIDISRGNNKTQVYSNKECIHGQCIRYSNNPQSFCQYKQGWSESDCSIPYNHTCASNSLCIGISANNRSICICRMNKFGSRCLSTDRIFENQCKNNGQCIPNDDNMITNSKFACICPKGFTGDRCE
jgi:hypothetical protein